MKFTNLFCFIMCCLFIAGCTNTNNTPTAISVPTQTSIPITETPILSTQTATPTLTPTIIPTLSVDDARAKLLELLANNGNCRLPCLWGITPGKSVAQQAQVILDPLTSISVLTSLSDSPGTLWPIYTEGDLRTSVELMYLFSNNGIISGIVFKAGEFKEDRTPVYDSKTFGEQLRLFMLLGILSEYGKPASVMIHTYGKQITGTGGFEVVLVYPDQGILVHYVTQMQTVVASVRGCPANAEVELELYPSGDVDSFVKSLSKTFWAPFVKREPIADLNWKAHWKPIDEATSMSLEQFYEIFRQPTDKCIETPANSWPTPEQ